MSTIQQERPGAESRLSLPRMILLALAWVALWRASALMEYAPHASIWFPPAALTLAAFLVTGYRAAIVLVPAAVAVTFWADVVYGAPRPTGGTLVAGLLFALAHGGAYLVGAAALGWIGRQRRALSLPARVIAFLVVASLSALLAARLGIEALILGGSLPRTDSAGLWLPWWVGDMAAAVTLTPLFAGLLAHRLPPARRAFPVIDLRAVPRPAGPWAMKLVVLLALLGLVMTLTAMFDQDEVLAFAVFFLIIPQMWITYTESAFRVAVSLAALSVLIALSVGLFGLDEQAMVYQFALTVIAASTWFGLAVPTLVEQNRRLRQIAEADELTGVTSRRHFFERSREELLLLRGRDARAALVIFDIDRFKQINDRLGHSAGDEALRRVADTVAARLRHDDLFGRFGGDEFMLLMPACSGDRAVARAEELRRALHDIHVPGVEAGLAGTFSVIELSPGDSITRAFDRADAMLLEAKRAGRDRVVQARG
ncbi:MAG: diguanylate cyclase [Gammaproteobacteria bacterium]|jgi:diguanylate cyclase (GGDEF)-like protein|nr:diguanylate cyclase [Gammaproteobacteria bacterium]